VVDVLLADHRHDHRHGGDFARREAVERVSVLNGGANEIL
jgi:hypothetical protein